MARTRTSDTPLPGPSFAPDDPVYRALSRIKGEGRRRLLLGLVLAGTPFEALPEILVRENLTAFEHAALDDAFALELTGELLPDLLPGEVEAARVIWSLPLDRRTASLRARPDLDGAAWRLVDDRGNSYELSCADVSWPPTVGDVARLLDEARSGSLPRGAGLFRSAWEEAIALGREDEKARAAAVVTAIFLGTGFHQGLADLVDELYDAYRAETALEEGPVGAAAAEVVQ